MVNKVGVFVDVGNQFYCINKKWPGRKLNYEKYLDKAKTFGSVIRAFAYGIQIDDTAANFILVLNYLGYIPQFKDIEKYTKFSWDIGMAMDIVRLHDKIDTVILGSSDRSVAPVISWAKEKGIQVVIIGCGISKELKTVCDIWIEIDESMLEVKEEEVKEEEGENAETNTTE